MAHVSAHYADCAWHGTAQVVANERVARDTYRIRIACPRIARRITPGQFVMVRRPDRDDPLLGRPLALYDVWPSEGTPQGIDLVYLIVGKMTRLLAETRPGENLEVWGPLGNGFSTEPAERLVMVAGGIGQTPFPALARLFVAGGKYGEPALDVAPIPRVTLCYGARSAEYLAGLDDFRSLGVETFVSTDDGSAGRHGRVTELLLEVLASESGSVRVACCGPEKMMEAVTEICRERQVACEVSLETPMACGLGICFSCVAKVLDASGAWDYRRVCVEGPVFPADTIVWR